ncbi:HLA class II histocompatibility antigen gamma chain [Carlito syrichta]|uniref:Ia antigen-associated invariant chain n=1 Tax=Carlito syrichta TaxID=1868482 RepID=A0A3Q0E9M6_CARSF|nr:HLA class II histocompatibility antigen gamma chain [Carlito syrichta]
MGAQIQGRPNPGGTQAVLWVGDEVGGVASRGRIRLFPIVGFKRCSGVRVPDTQAAAAAAGAVGRPELRAMEDQRDLISNHEQLPMLGQRPRAPERCSRGAVYTGFSVLVALLLAGQATTAYFLYQQQGRLDKLTVTSQNLQLENLRMKLPKPPKPLMSQMRMATPLLMQALPMGGLPQGPVQNATKHGNMTQDHVMHLLLKGNPLKVFPQMKGSLPENLRHLKDTMNPLEWKVFESWMHHWLLFEMSKYPSEEKPTEDPPKAQTKCQEEVSRVPAVHPGTFSPKCDENGNYMPLQCYGSTGYCWCVFPNGTEVPHTRSRGHRNCSESLDLEDLSSGLDVTKQEMGQVFV